MVLCGDGLGRGRSPYAGPQGQPGRPGSGSSCVAGELPPESSGRRWGRLAAERTVVSLSDLVLVVEAERADELFAVELARATEGRIAAVPGRATAPPARGPLELLRAGASLVRAADDVLELFGRPVAPSTTSAIEHLPRRLSQVLDRVGSDSDTRATAAARRPRRDPARAHRARADRMCAADPRRPLHRDRPVLQSLMSMSVVHGILPSHEDRPGWRVQADLPAIARRGRRVRRTDRHHQARSARRPARSRAARATRRLAGCDARAGPDSRGSPATGSRALGLGRPAQVKLLLDTHTWLWRLLDPGQLSADAERAIADRESELHLSPVSTWETLVLARKGRLTLTPSPSEWVLDALRRSAPTRRLSPTASLSAARPSPTSALKIPRTGSSSRPRSSTTSRSSRPTPRSGPTRRSAPSGSRRTGPTALKVRAMSWNSCVTTLGSTEGPGRSSSPATSTERRCTGRSRCPGPDPAEGLKSHCSPPRPRWPGRAMPTRSASGECSARRSGRVACPSPCP